MEPPLATEETGHIWIREGTKDVNLTAEVAQHIWSEWGQYEIRVSEAQMLEIAQVVLSHPILEEALSQWLASRDQDEEEMR